MGSGVSTTARTEQLELLPPQLRPDQLRFLLGSCFDADAFPEPAPPAADEEGAGDGVQATGGGLISRERVVAELRARGIDVGGSDVFWANLRHTLHVRRGLDAAYAALPRHQDLKHNVASFDATKVGGARRAGQGADAFDGALRQQSLLGAPAANLSEVFAAGRAARPVFEALLARAAEAAGIEESRVKSIALESRARAGEKAHAKFGARDPGPSVAWLFDVVRGKVVCETGGEVLALYEHIRGATKTDSSVQIVCTKNRFRSPSFIGYRDMLVKIRVRVPTTASTDKEGGADGDSDGAAVAAIASANAGGGGGASSVAASAEQLPESAPCGPACGLYGPHDPHPARTPEAAVSFAMAAPRGPRPRL